MSARERLARAGRTAGAAVRRAAGARPRWRRMRVLEWNVKVGRSFAREIRPQLDAWLAEHRPHAVTLIECYGIADDLAAYYGPRGWKVIYDHTDHPEARDVVLMVRARRRPTRLPQIRHRLPWMGPVHDRPREGRSFPGALTPFAGWLVALYGIHKVPDPATNSATVSAESDVIRRGLSGVLPDTILRMPGDWNSAGRRLAEFAASIGADVTVGDGVDAELHSAPDAARMTVTSRVLGRGGSDHFAVLFTARIRRRARKAKP